MTDCGRLDGNLAGATVEPSLVVFSGRLQELGWIDWVSEHSASIFDPASGQTHIVNAFPAEILRHVGDRVCSLQNLATTLAGECGASCDDAWVDTVLQSARALCALGLLSMLTPPADEAPEPAP